MKYIFFHSVHLLVKLWYAFLMHLWGKLQCSLVGEAVVCIFNASLVELQYAFLMHIEFSYQGEVDFLMKLLYAFLMHLHLGKGSKLLYALFDMCILGKGNMYYKYILGRLNFCTKVTLASIHGRQISY